MKLPFFSLMIRRQLSIYPLMNASQWLVEYLVAFSNCLFFFFRFGFSPTIIIIYIYIFARLLFGFWLICLSIFGHNFFFFIKQLGQALRTCLRRQLDALRPRSGVAQHCRAHTHIHAHSCFFFVFVFNLFIFFNYILMGH